MARSVRWLVLLCVVALAMAPMMARGAAPDDEIPGIALPAPGFQGALDAVHSELSERDLNDVYRVELAKGQWFYAALSGAAGSDYDLHLFGPSATSVDGAEHGVAYSEREGTSTERLLYKATTAGTHFLGVYAFDGAGWYRVKYGFPSDTPALTVSAAATVKWDTAAEFSGSLVSVAGPVADTTLRLYAKEAGSSAWKATGSVKTTSAGHYKITAKPKKKTAYQVRYLGDSRFLPAASPILEVTPRAYLTRPTVPLLAKAGTTFTSTGLLKPRHIKGAKDVKVLCYLLEVRGDGTREYALAKTFSAVNSDFLGYTRYSARVRLPQPGRWKLVATIAGDTLHAKTTTSGRYVTVR